MARLGMVALASLLALAGLALPPVRQTLRPDGLTELRVATSWVPRERAALEKSYRDHLGFAVRIEWIEMGRGEDALRTVRRSPRLDAVLGGPESDFERLRREGWLATPPKLGLGFDSGAEPNAQPEWVIARSSTLGIAYRESAVLALGARPETLLADMASETMRDRLAWTDPRRDPIVLAWAESRLESQGWVKGWLELARVAANAASEASGRRGRMTALTADRSVLAAPAASHEVEPGSGIGFEPLPDPKPPLWTEGAAVLQGSAHPRLAREFVRMVQERAALETMSPSRIPRFVDWEARRLRADLLGAVLTDSQNALRAAAKSGSLEARWGGGPPWPPPWVVKVRRERDEADASRLLATLVKQMVPDDRAGAWLLVSWDRPKPNSDVIQELSRAQEGRLVREPRFRAWLRGEWTSWAQGIAPSDSRTETR